MGDGGLAGGPLLVEEEDREGGRLIVGIEAEDGVEAATPFLTGLRFRQPPESCLSSPRRLHGAAARRTGSLTTK